MMFRIKTLLVVCALTIVSVFASLSVSAPAHAKIQQGLDCSAGCVIYTCDDNGLCTVWHCSGKTGCVIVGSFEMPQRVLPKSPSLDQADSSGLVSDGASKLSSVEYVKVCPSDDVCDLYQLTTSAATLIGHFDNIDATAKKLSSRVDADGSVAYVKVCPDDKICDLYELTTNKATVVGRFDNIDGTVKMLEAEAASGKP